jgi:NAD(P)-dependent dehydrogenase (short-subunit alcohol dehydrogenase family)
MAFTVQPDSFRFEREFGGAVAGKRVLITGAGKDGGLGQAFALAAGLNGAAAVGVHFHSSYSDGFDLVNALRNLDVNAFPVQADVTNLGDLWATRSYVIEQMGGKPPNLLICNSGLTEKGYAFGRALKEIPNEPLAMRRARVRQHFIDSLHESRLVLNTKIDGFLAMTHLWAGEAVYHQEFLQLVYVSSRQAIDPGVSVPGYVISNWGVLEPNEAAKAFMQLLARPQADLDKGLFELMVDGAPDNVDVTWKRVQLDVREEAMEWSMGGSLQFHGQHRAAKE